MPLIVDRSQGSNPLDDEALRAWAARRTVFISSEMRELGPERRAVAAGLSALGMRVVMFEDLGGRDDDAVTAYLDGVARSDVYLGVVADRYGTMLPSGRSPTHEEYREARRRGLRIAVWVAADGAGRQGDARDFVDELRAFHTTGTYADVDSLVRSVRSRLLEMAADEDSPWVKIGNVVFRAESIEDDGRNLVISMQTRDRDVLAAIRELRPNAMRSGHEVAVTTFDGSGSARITEVASAASSATASRLRIAAAVEWADGRRPSTAAGLNGVTVEEQVAVGLSAGLFGTPLPPQLGLLASSIDSSDPLADLDRLGLPFSVYEPVARLLIVERLVGRHAASRVEHVAVGPEHVGSREVEVAWTDARYAQNVEPERRELSGTRRPPA